MYAVPCYEDHHRVVHLRTLEDLLAAAMLAEFASSLR